MDYEQRARQIGEDVEQYVQQAEDALEEDDLRGAIEHARFAARSVGKMNALAEQAEQDAPVSSKDGMVRQLYTAINNRLNRDAVEAYMCSGCGDVAKHTQLNDGKAQINRHIGQMQARDTPNHDDRTEPVPLYRR